MNRRKAFRPQCFDVLEDRVVLSRGGWAGHLTHRPPAAPLLQRIPAQDRLGPIGTLGDSFTDDYRYYPPDRVHARNWVDILSATRGVRFGPFSHVSLGEPRNQGYAYNWARSDATTSDMVANQLPGLAEQVARGLVRDVTILIGGNDFLEVLYGVAGGVVTPEQAIGLMPQVAQRASQNFGTAVQAILAANPEVRVVVSTINVTTLPIVQAGFAGLPQGPALQAATNAAVEQYNALIRQVAEASPRVGLMDLATLGQGVIPPGATSFPFGGTTIRLGVGDDFHDSFLADGVHPGTVVQGIIANLFLEAFRREFGVGVRPLSETEIVRFARQAQHAPPPRSVLHRSPQASRAILPIRLT